MIEGHGQQDLESQAEMATLQLVVLSLIDPTGVVALGLTGIASLWLTSRKYVHSREHEMEADALGLRICGRACFDLQGTTSFMRKLHSGGPQNEHHNWYDTHPSGPERLAALVEEAGRGFREHKFDHCSNTKASLSKSYSLFRNRS